MNNTQTVSRPGRHQATVDMPTATPLMANIEFQDPISEAPSCPAPAAAYPDDLPASGSPPVSSHHPSTMSALSALLTMSPLSTISTFSTLSTNTHVWNGPGVGHRSSQRRHRRRRHVAPGRVPSTDPGSSAGQCRHRRAIHSQIRFETTNPQLAIQQNGSSPIGSGKDYWFHPPSRMHSLDCHEWRSRCRSIRRFIFK